MMLQDPDLRLDSRAGTAGVAEVIMKWRSTGEVREPKTGEPYLTWPLNSDYKRIVETRYDAHLFELGPRVIMERVQDDDADTP